MSRAEQLKLPKRPKVPERKISAARIRAVWFNLDLTVDQAAAEVGLAYTALKSRARALGLPPRKQGVRPAISEPSQQHLFRAMWEAHVRTNQIGSHFQIRPVAVRDTARRMGLVSRTPSTRRRLISLDRFWRERTEAAVAAALIKAAEAERLAAAQHSRRQDQDDYAVDPIAPVTSSRPKGVAAELRARGASVAQIARDLGFTPSMVGAVAAGRKRSKRIEAAIAAALSVGDAEPSGFAAVAQKVHASQYGRALLVAAPSSTRAAEHRPLHSER